MENCQGRFMETNISSNVMILLNTSEIIPKISTKWKILRQAISALFLLLQLQYVDEIIKPGAEGKFLSVILLTWKALCYWWFCSYEGFSNHDVVLRPHAASRVTLWSLPSQDPAGVQPSVPVLSLSAWWTEESAGQRGRRVVVAVVIAATQQDASWAWHSYAFSRKGCHPTSQTGHSEPSSG